jgi:hypothetical protein
MAVDLADLEQLRQPEQPDASLVKDRMQEATRLLRRCAQDLGDRYLADLIDQAPSTVHNQLDGGDPNKRASFDLAIALACSHDPFRRALVQLLSPPPTLEPEEGIAEIERDVLPTLGEHDARKLRGILGRVKKSPR